MPRETTVIFGAGVSGKVSEMFSVYLDYSGEIGGSITRFRTGDLHRLALDVPIDNFCMAGIVNEYAEKEPSDAPIYWAIWSNQVVQ